MKRRVLAIVVVVVVAGVGWWWWRDREAPDARGAEATSGTTLAESGHGRGDRAPAALAARDPRRGARRVAGRVLAGGRPAVATVSVAMDHEAIATLTSRPDGSFEVHGLPETLVRVAASHPEHTGSLVRVSLREGDRTDLELALTPCLRVITGTIVDAGGGPISGARITASESYSDTGGATVSGPDGRYRLCSDNLSLELDVRADGYASEHRALRSGTALADFTLSPEAVLSGITVDPTGARVPFAFVVVEPDRGTSGDAAAGGSAVSDADGAFEVRGLGAGDHELHARASGMAMPAPVGATATVGAPASVELVLHPAATIRGHARLAAGAPAAKVEIVWLHHTGLRAVAVTDDTGAFTIRDASHGAGAFFATGYAFPDGPRTAGTEPIELTLRPLAAGTIRGRVSLEGRPIADARLVVAEVIGYDRGRSRADGTFVVEQDSGRVTLVAESDALGLASEPVTIDLRAGEDRTGVELVLAPRGAFAGTVVDGHGAPLVGAAVTLRRADVEHLAFEANRVPTQAVVAADGTFRVALLTAGPYDVRVALHGKQLELTSGPARVTIASASARVEGVRLVASVKRVQFAGLVVDSAGTPVADALVSLQADGGIYTRRADGAGQFRLDVLEAWRYRLTARGAPGTETTFEQVAPATDLRLQLAASGRLRLACAAPGGAVAVYPSSGARMRATCGGLIARIPVGPVFARLDATDGGGAAMMGTATVIAGAEATLTVAPVAIREVHVRVTGKGAPIAGVMCAVDAAPGNTLSSNGMYVTGADGIAKAQAPALPARLQCLPPGGAWKPYRRTLAPDERDVTVELAASTD